MAEQTNLAATNKVVVKAEYSRTVNFVTNLTKEKVLRKLTITNHCGERLSDIAVKVTPTPAFAPPITRYVDRLHADATHKIPDAELVLDVDFLDTLQEKLPAALVVEAFQGEELLFADSLPLQVQPLNEWPGTAIGPETIAAFVTSNHPLIKELKQKLDAQFPGDPTQGAYYLGPDHVQQVLRAIYDTIRSLNLTYSTCPPSFDASGQRVRLFDEITTYGRANCVEMSCVFAALMEALGLHPLMIGVRGHMFAGCWVESRTFDKAVVKELSGIVQHAEAGNLVLVECTAANAGKTVSYEDACVSALGTIKEPGRFEYCIDVARARAAGYRPMPTRTKQADGTWRMRPRKAPQPSTDPTIRFTPSKPAPQPTPETEPEKQPEPRPVTPEPEKQPEPPTVTPDPAPQPEPQTEPEKQPAPQPEPETETEPLTPEQARFARWERELMRLGSGNSMIHLKAKDALPLLSADPCALVGLLKGACRLLPFPGEQAKDSWDFPALTVEADLAPQLEMSESHGSIHTLLSSKRLESLIGELTRTAARLSQDSGAHPLQLAVGFVNWQEADRDGHRHTRNAPLMLYPVELIRQENAMCLRRVGDGEVNEPVIEKLRRELNLDLSSLSRMDAVKDPAAVLSEARKRIVGAKDVYILPAAAVANFTFRSMQQWSELHENREEILSHPLCASLYHGKLMLQPAPVTEDEGQLLPTRRLDPSQRKAVAASTGAAVSILVGPPGTGKSETISASMENNAAMGRTVLFVTGKSEAQDAVYTRLQQSGMGEHCLVLRPGAKGKQEAVRQLRATVERTLEGIPARPAYHTRREKLEKLLEEYRGYDQGLHRPGASGMTLYDLIEESETLHSCRYLFPPDQAPAPETVTRERLRAQGELMDKLVYLCKRLEPAKHPLRHLCATAGDRDTENAIRQELTDYIATLDTLSDTAKRFAAVTGDPERAVKELDALAGHARHFTNLPKNFANMEPLACFDAMERVADDVQAAQRLRRQLARNFDESFLGDAGDELLARYDGRGLRSLTLTRAVQAHTALPLTRDTAATYLEQLRRLKTMERRIAQWGESVDALQTSAQQYRSAYQALLRLLPDADTARHVAENGALAQAYLDCREAASHTPACLRPADLEGLESRQIRELCADTLAELGGLSRWSQWSRLRPVAEKLDMAVVMDVMEAGCPGDTALDIFRKTLCEGLISHAIRSDTALRDFSMIHDHLGETIRTETDALREDARGEVLWRIASRIDSADGNEQLSKEAGLLQRWLKNSRSMTVRKLFEAAPGIITTVCPCIIASPMTLASYLPYQRGQFDVVIFDEASQLLTAESVAALSRCKDDGCILICGDPNQMPPTRYFTASTAPETEDLELVDLESVLDDCAALSLPRMELRYHYRSRHEDLIAFSNHAFYDGKLITLPGVTDGVSHVKLVSVNGVYGRGGDRCNEAEAEALVSELQRRCDAGSTQTIGIITMNVQQQALVEKRIAEACAADEDLRQWLQGLSEPLFVQNLENVQGSERDVILLSLNYGPDSEGKVSLTMGPLNREGGYRRFNVAISRAREELLVYSSITPEHIDPRRTSAKGLLVLREFLDFAATGKLPGAAGKGNAHRRSNVADAICKKLTAAGWNVRRDLGSSDFRVNIAVEDPDRPGSYRLGILLDEKTDLDRLALTWQLERSGWKVLPVHALDWYRDPKSTMTTILSALN